MIHSQIPETIKPVPNKASLTRVCSPKSIPKMAVAANVVALVTGTANEIGASLMRAKKVAEADRFIKNGSEYCQNKKSLTQLSNETKIFRRRLGGFDCGAEDDLIVWSQRSAPRRIRAFVAPQTKPTATILSMSPIIRSINQLIGLLICLSLLSTSMLFGEACFGCQVKRSGKA